MPVSISWSCVGLTLLPNVGGIAGGLITKNNINSWYSSIKKPSWTPPNWVFGPVWTSLYCSMGYASYLVVRDGGGFNETTKLPLLVYGTNLTLNWAWSFIFFGAHKIKLAFYELQLINLTAIGSAYLFHKINPLSGLILIPYMSWLGLASALNFFCMKNNIEDTDSLNKKE